MKIAVCMKQVVSPDAPLTVDTRTGWIRESELPHETNEPDLYALELALTLKENHQGEVTAITAGPDRAVGTLRDALARGADHAIHIVDAEALAHEPLQTAHVIASMVRESHYDLILTGLQSADFGYGQTGVMIAELLDLPHVTMVVEVRSEQDRLRVRRELEAGSSQWWDISLPCVLTVQSGINRPRYAGVKGIMAAKKRPVRTVPWAGSHGTPLQATLACETLVAPAAREDVLLLSGSVPDVAAQLAERLRVALGH